MSAPGGYSTPGECIVSTRRPFGLPISNQKSKKKDLFKQPVIRRFISDQDVVGVALGHAGIGDADELCIFLHMWNCLGTGVAHR